MKKMVCSAWKQTPIMCVSVWGGVKGWVLHRSLWMAGWHIFIPETLTDAFQTLYCLLGVSMREHDSGERHSYHDVDLQFLGV